MKMTLHTRVCMSLAVALGMTGSALAAGIAPPNYAFMKIGAGNLVKNGNNGWACSWTLNMQTGSSLGGNPARAGGGTMSGGTAGTGNCTQMTVDPSSFTITASDANGGSGVFNGLTFRQNGTVFCTTGSSVPFTYVNNGSAPSSLQFVNANVGSNCTYIADLKTATDLNVVA